jgi:hypothetical protein
MDITCSCPWAAGAGAQERRSARFRCCRADDEQADACCCYQPLPFAGDALGAEVADGRDDGAVGAGQLKGVKEADEGGGADGHGLCPVSEDAA